MDCRCLYFPTSHSFFHWSGFSPPPYWNYFHPHHWRPAIWSSPGPSSLRPSHLASERTNFLRIPSPPLRPGFPDTALSRFPPTPTSFLLRVPFPLWNPSRLLFSREGLQPLSGSCSSWEPGTLLASSWPALCCRLPAQHACPQLLSDFQVGAPQALHSNQM